MRFDSHQHGGARGDAGRNNYVLDGAEAEDCHAFGEPCDKAGSRRRRLARPWLSFSLQTLRQAALFDLQAVEAPEIFWLRLSAAATQLRQLRSQQEMRCPGLSWSASRLDE